MIQSTCEFLNSNPPKTDDIVEFRKEHFLQKTNEQICEGFVLLSCRTAVFHGSKSSKSLPFCFIGQIKHTELSAQQCRVICWLLRSDKIPKDSTENFPENNLPTVSDSMRVLLFQLLLIIEE
jgi:hypothetical protein